MAFGDRAEHLANDAATTGGLASSQARRALLLAAGCLGLAVVFTLACVYLINALLFDQVGGSRSGEEIRAMARQWIFADRLRFVFGVVAFLDVFRLSITDR